MLQTPEGGLEVSSTIWNPAKSLLPGHVPIFCDIGDFRPEMNFILAIRVTTGSITFRNSFCYKSRNVLQVALSIMHNEK